MGPLLAEGHAVLPGGDEISRSPRIDQIVWAFVALGAALRLLRYLLRFPLWGDECMLSANFLDRGYLELTNSLDGKQIAPLLFLWTQRGVVQLFGFSEWTLRLFPTLCSLASLFLFRHLARRLLTGAPLALAMGIFAVSYYPLRHGAEAKPYSCDLFMALGLLTLAVEALRQPGAWRPWIALLCFAPLAVGYSYPAAFVGGGVTLTLLFAALKQRAERADARPLWGGAMLFGALTVAAFLAIYFAASRFQMAAGEAADIGGNHWAQSFPPRDRPWRIPLWLLDMHTGRMFAYPIGGPRGTSAGTTLCVLAAVVALVRRRATVGLWLLLAPLGLGLVAAALQKYPYGDSARVMQYTAPAICLLAGYGAAVVIEFLGRRVAQRQAAHQDTLPHGMSGGALVPAGASTRRLVLAAIGVLAVIGIASGVRDAAFPFKTPFDFRHQQFAAWFWDTLGHDAEVAGVADDLGAPLYDPTLFRHAATDYRCYKRIYGGRTSGPDLSRVTAERPLRCVVYRKPGVEPDPQALATWLASMEQRFTLRERTSLRVNPDAGEVHDQTFDVYEFVPRGDESATQAARRTDAPPAPR